MQVAAVSPNPSSAAGSGSSTQSSATSAFGLSFDSLLKIVLTQLTYQDPLKPMDNFQFVSQLAQFSQIQLGQTTNDDLQSLLVSQGNQQATGLLGKKVDLTSGTSGAPLVTGTVTAIALDSGAPLVTIQTTDGSTISGIALGNITQVREGN